MTEQTTQQRKRVPPPEQPQDDEGQAEKESQAFADKKNLEKQAEENDHYRNEGIKDVLIVCIKIVIYIFFVTLVSGIAIWAFHMLASTSLHWLNSDQIIELQKIMSSALLAIVINEGARKYLK